MQLTSYIYVMYILTFSPHREMLDRAMVKRLRDSDSEEESENGPEKSRKHKAENPTDILTTDILTTDTLTTDTNTGPQVQQPRDTDTTSVSC